MADIADGGRFLRNRMLLGPDSDRLASAHVAVFGLGGVGSFAAEGLARAGVGRLTLVDYDEICLTNINRQLGALSSTIGRPKTEVMAERIWDINPAAEVRSIVGRYEPGNRDRFWGNYGCVVDAIDQVTGKVDLIVTAKERKIPILSALGTANKLDPTALTVCDISQTVQCPLARVVRRELRRRGVIRHTVVYSPEPRRVPSSWDEPPPEAPPPGRRSVPAAVVWVPGCAGLILAGACVRLLIDGGREDVP